MTTHSYVTNFSNRNHQFWLVLWWWTKIQLLLMRQTRNKATNKMDYNTVQAEETLKHSILNDISHRLIPSAVLIWHVFFSALLLICPSLPLRGWRAFNFVSLLLSAARINSAQRIRLCSLYKVHITISHSVEGQHYFFFSIVSVHSPEQEIHCTQKLQTFWAFKHSLSEGFFSLFEKNCLKFCTSIFTTICVRRLTVSSFVLSFTVCHSVA